MKKIAMINSTSLKQQSFSLTYLDRFKIENKKEGLSEPSGLALSHRKNGLWTISDDTKKIFKLSLDGDLKKDKSFKIPDKGLEGIVLDPTGEFLLTIKEDDNTIIKVQVNTQKVTDRQRLAKMAGYDAIRPYFASSGANKGLEGITWNENTQTIFVMKEGNPGLLVEVSSDLQRIQSHQLLNDENGFRDTEVGAEELDFSDICYDQSRDRFWIVSDKAKRLFLYDWKENKVIQSAKLGYGKQGAYREIKKAEGVAIDPEANRLYVVSDEEARLYVFDIRE
ncbi:MAG: hypothetical protein F6K10_02855 [Moorea sp. SIO2B7]|nr:hypothetical protein [Moorena sp. SIO2B7]